MFLYCNIHPSALPSSKAASVTSSHMHATSCQKLNKVDMFLFKYSFIRLTNKQSQFFILQGQQGVINRVGRN